MALQHLQKANIELIEIALVNAERYKHENVENQHQRGGNNQEGCFPERGLGAWFNDGLFTSLETGFDKIQQGLASAYLFSRLEIKLPDTARAGGTDRVLHFHCFHDQQWLVF